MITYHYEGLYRVISGGQTGSDQAGLYEARQAHIETGGSICRGWRTSLGPMPKLGEMFGLIEHSSMDYPPRTKQNAIEGDATVRLASNFKTAGEVLTLKYCRAANKPVFDILLDGNDYDQKAEDFVEFLKRHSVGVLNVAGNADRDTQYGYHFTQASTVLHIVFALLKKEGLLKFR